MPVTATIVVTGTMRPGPPRTGHVSASPSSSRRRTPSATCAMVGRPEAGTDARPCGPARPADPARRGPIHPTNSARSRPLTPTRPTPAIRRDPSAACRGSRRLMLAVVAALARVGAPATRGAGRGSGGATVPAAGGAPSPRRRRPWSRPRAWRTLDPVPETRPRRPRLPLHPGAPVSFRSAPAICAPRRARRGPAAGARTPPTRRPPSRRPPSAARCSASSRTGSSSTPSSVSTTRASRRSRTSASPPTAERRPRDEGQRRDGDVRAGPGGEPGPDRHHRPRRTRAASRSSSRSRSSPGRRARPRSRRRSSTARRPGRTS